MTPREEYLAHVDMVRRSALLADTRAERHGVYAVRVPPVVPLPVKPVHVFVIPTVRPL
jgi:hypothetical protein